MCCRTHGSICYTTYLSFSIYLYLSIFLYLSISDARDRFFFFPGDVGYNVVNFEPDLARIKS